MKRSFSVFILSIFFAGSIFAFFENSDVVDPRPTQPFPHITAALNHNPTSLPVIINDKELSIYFEFADGNATVTIYDANDQIISQEAVEINAATSTNISIDTLNPGSYKLTVTTENSTLTGHFIIQ